MVKDKEAQDALRAAEDALEDAIRRQSMLQSQCHQSISEIVHDIKNPLSAMMGYLDLINNEIAGPIGNDAYKPFLKTLDRSTNRILEICNALLEKYSKEENRKKLRKMVKVAALTEEIRDLFAAKAEEREVVLEAHVPSRFPDIKADPHDMYRVLTNLVSNSIKYTPRGGKIQIQTEIDEKDDSFWMIVRDSGVGMSKDQINNVIKSHRPNQKPIDDAGSGQGLAIVNRIIRDIGGSMDIISTENRGTRIKLHFPRKITSLRQKL